MLTLKNICTDLCKQFCNRICTFPCKPVAQVKKFVRSNICPDPCKRGLILFLFGTNIRKKERLERFSYDLEKKTREQHRKNKWTEIERFDWFIERIQTCVAFGWFFNRTLDMSEKTSCPRISRNQPILRFDVILQHDFIFFGGKTKRSCFDLFIHWLINQITNTYRNHFSRSYENRSIVFCFVLLLFLPFENTFITMNCSNFLL